MGAIRKPRFSDCDVEKAMDGFFNNLIEPDKKVHVQYTTTSPIMHKRLGVAD
jgi:hypothetical protein